MLTIAQLISADGRADARCDDCGHEARLDLERLAAEIDAGSVLGGRGPLAGGRRLRCSKCGGRSIFVNVSTSPRHNGGLLATNIAVWPDETPKPKPRPETSAPGQYP